LSLCSGWLADRWALAASFIHLVRQLLSALLHQLYLVLFLPIATSWGHHSGIAQMVVVY